MIPYGRQLIEDDDIEAVVEALKSPMLTTGPFVERFEQAFSEVTGADHTVVCNSGTAALHLASMAAELGPGDVAVVPAITFLATANAPAMTGANVVFADVDPITGLMTPDTFGEALSRAADIGRPAAVLPVHLNGHCADMPAISAMARESNMAIIEDACHALGGAVPGPGNELIPVGSCDYSDIAAFSFHPVKTIAMGEGGATTTNDAEKAARMRRLRNHGMTRDPADFTIAGLALDNDGAVNPWYYEMHALGWNYRASDINCALGLSQLRKLEVFSTRRRELSDRYRNLLSPMAPMVRTIEPRAGQRTVCHLQAIHIDFEAVDLSRRVIMQRLREKGIGSQVHYIPVYQQPYWRKRANTPELTGATRYYRGVLSLPLFVDMKDEHVDAVVHALSAALTG